MQYIVTNFAYGTGPYVRTTELAVAFNDERARRGYARMPIIVPLVYGDKQKRVMREEFGAHIETFPDEILLDATLGAILRKVFYTGHARYEETLRAWVATAEAVSDEAHVHLGGLCDVELFSGERRVVDGRDIALEISRSPRIRYDVAPAYATTFGHVADILENALGEKEGTVAVEKALLEKGVRLADSVEGRQDLHLMAYPATFSWERTYVPRYTQEIVVPPLTNLPRPDHSSCAEGIFVTITGIEGLERLYAEARALGLKLYSNDVAAVAGAERMLPHIIPNPAIRCQFARAGWGSIWLSMFSGTPLLVPAFDPTDDPEILYNNRAVEGLGIGVVYSGQSLEDILTEGVDTRIASAELCTEIELRFGTLSGNEVAARVFVEKFESR